MSARDTDPMGRDLAGEVPITDPQRTLPHVLDARREVRLVLVSASAPPQSGQVAGRGAS